MICKNCKSRMKKDNNMKVYLNSKKKSYHVSAAYRCKNCDWSYYVFKNQMWVDENNEEVSE